MSRNGERVAFVTWINGRNVVVDDGRPGELFDAVTWPLALSDDGRVVAYSARQGSDQFCVVAGRRSAPYRSVLPPLVSADGRTVAFAASDGAHWFVVMNDRPGPNFRWVGNLALHPSGDVLAYAAEDASGSFVVFDGRRDSSFERVTRPVISGDRRHVAYGTRGRGHCFLVVDGKESPIDYEAQSVFLSDDGSRAGYVAEEAGRSFIVGPEGKGPFFDWIGWPAFAKDGRLVYFAARGKAKLLVVEKQVVELGDVVVWDPVLSEDGTRIGFGARIGRTLHWKEIVLPTSGGAHSGIGKGDKP